jgi:hypothetical protein
LCLPQEHVDFLYGLRTARQFFATFDGQRRQSVNKLLGLGRW